MKKFDPIQFIAALCLLVGSVINFVEIFTDIPFALSIVAICLLVVSVCLHGIVFRRYSKQKKQKADENKESE